MIVRLSGRFLLVLVVAWSAIVPIGLGTSGASADRVPTRRPWTAESDQAVAYFGYSVGTPET
jgi:hypothetical protein